MENLRTITVSPRDNKFYIIALTYQVLRDLNNYTLVNEYMDDLKNLENYTDDAKIFSIIKKYVAVKYTKDQNISDDFGGPNNPPSTNKYIIKGSDEEFDKYNKKVYDLYEELEMNFQDADDYLIENHISGYKTLDGLEYHDYESFMTLMFGDERDLSVTCSVTDAIDKTMSCPVCEKFITIDREDLILMSEFIRCFGF